MMGLVAGVALFLGFMAAQRRHLEKWEARRVVMYLQRDATQAILSEAMARVADAEPKESRSPYVFESPTRTANWSIAVRDFQANKLGSERVKVSGANGEFALKPILIEIRDPRLVGPLLLRLEREYRERGWPFEVVSPRIRDDSSGANL
ncbi:hypothetical protein TA3x_005222 [Tundrisphaera sp. TA3]|uniref:hypothetical protein n=1 Tax=Tundrisphaera sp. TA3 TaxID=3435775 RepID=UPI003EB8A6F0